MRLVFGALALSITALAAGPGRAGPACTRTHDCSHRSICAAGQCVDVSSPSVWEAFLAAGWLADVCVPEGTRGAGATFADYCYLNDGSCAPGCHAAIAVHSVAPSFGDAGSWGTAPTIILEFQLDSAFSAPIDGAVVFVPFSCTAEVTHVDAPGSFTIGFAADGTPSVLPAPPDLAATASFANCGALADVAGLASDLVDGLAGQVAPRVEEIGRRLEAFLQPTQQELACRSVSSFDPAGVPGLAVDEEIGEGTCASALDADVADLAGNGAAVLGMLHARSSASFLAADADLAETSTTVSFRDALTVSADGLEGELATVHAEVFVPGVVDLSGASEGSLSVALEGPFASSVWVEDCAALVGACNGAPAVFPRPVSETLEIDFDVVLGMPMPFGLRLETAAGRPPSALAGSAEVDFTSGVVWRGIQEVTHAGSPLAFTVASESGFDWASPVPEPGRPVLLLVGIAVLARRARRRACPGGSPG